MAICDGHAAIVEELKLALDEAHSLEAGARAAISREDLRSPEGGPFATSPLTLATPRALPASRTALPLPRSGQCEHGVMPTEMCSICFPDSMRARRDLGDAICDGLIALHHAVDAINCVVAYHDAEFGYVNDIVADDLSRRLREMHSLC